MLPGHPELYRDIRVTHPWRVLAGHSGGFRLLDPGRFSGYGNGDYVRWYTRPGSGSLSEPVCPGPGYIRQFTGIQ